MSYVRLALVAFALLPACKKREEAKPAPTAPPVATPKRNIDAKALQSKQAVRSTLLPITVDEVKALMPAPSGARELKPLAKAPVGERVVATYCFDKGELPELMTTVQQTYEGAGWAPLTVKPNPKVENRAFLVGQKAPYTLSGTLQRGGWPECDQAKGQTYLMVGTHHLAAKEAPGNTIVNPNLKGITTGGIRPTEPAVPPQQ